MTAPHRPDPDDLASALLDGQLDADEAAAARRDPAVVARIVALTEARDALAAPPPAPDPAEREQAIAAALSAFDAETSPADDDATAAAVPEQPPSTTPGRFDHATPLPRRTSRPPAARRRGPRSARNETWARWLGAAAAAVLVVAGVSLLARNSDSDDADTAATSAEISEQDSGAANDGEGLDEAGDDAAGDESEESAGGDSAGSFGSDKVFDLGAADSPEALADRARSTLDDAGALSRLPTSELDPGAAPDTTDATPDDNDEDGAASAQVAEPLACPTGDDTAAARSGTVDLRARASLDGRPVEVWVLDVGGSLTLLAVDAGCAVVVDGPLPD